MYNEDFSTVTVNGESYAVISSLEKLGDSFLIDEVMKPILDGINNNRYVSILSDAPAPPKDKDIYYTWIVPDTRSRVINYSLFLEELRNNINNIPKELAEDMEKDAISCLISRTYLVKPENMEELQDYISKLSLKDITNDEISKTLYNFTRSLNRARRSYVERESQYTALSFDTEEARQRWEKTLKTKQLCQDINAFVITDSMECITDPLEVRTNEEHYTTMDGIEYFPKKQAKYRTASAAKVDYNAFCDKLKNALSTVSEDERAKFISNVIGNSINIWYGYGSNYPNDRTIDCQRDKLSEELEEILTKKINANDKNAVDMTRVAEIEKNFLELSKEEETICLETLEKRTPKSFENVNVENNFKIIKSIHEIEAIPEESKKSIIQDIKAKNKAELASKRSINAFAKLALTGNNIPTAEDIRQASKIIDFYRDEEIGRN